MRWSRNLKNTLERKESAYIVALCVCAVGLLFFVVDRMGGDTFVLRSKTPLIRTGTATTTGIIKEIDQNEGIFVLEEGEEPVRLLVETVTIRRIEDENKTAIPISFLDTGFHIGLTGIIRGNTFAAEHIWIIKSPPIVIREPIPNAEMGDAFIAHGLAPLSSHTLTWRLIDEDAHERAQGTTSVYGIPHNRYGFFSFPITVKKTSLQKESMLLEISADTTEKEGMPYQSTTSIIMTDQPMFAVSLYFINSMIGTEERCENVFETARAMSATTTPEYASVEALLRGPTVRERRNGFVSLLPEGVVYKGFELLRNRAIVTLTSPISFLSECRKTAIRSAFVRMLSLFPRIQKVEVVFDETN